MLHIGENRIVSREEIVAILPENCGRTGRMGAAVILKDGRVEHSILSAGTLVARLSSPLRILLGKQNAKRE